MLNILALNSARHFGGRALLVDAGNNADPYLIRREADLRKKDSSETRRLLQSILMLRVFTCHQLTNFVTEQLPTMLSKNENDENPFRFVGLCGFDRVFSEEESSRREISNLQFLIAKKLSEVAKKKSNGTLFVVASSETLSSHFLNFSDVAIEIYHDKKTGTEKAVLIQHSLGRVK
jgi:hypothetical protein